VKAERERQPWQPCPRGELDRLQVRLRARRLWRYTVNVVVGAVVVAAVTIVTVHAAPVVYSLVTGSNLAPTANPQGNPTDPSNCDPQPCPPRQLPQQGTNR
jgi:hypothetical protein